MISTPTRGRLHAWRVRWFGERDTVAEQLADIARQGSRMAALAHVAAAVMMLLFSAGALVALGGDVLSVVIRSWQAGTPNIPALISLGVTALLVPCMDLGMLYAASRIRLLASRRVTGGAVILHTGVMLGVSLLEGATYCYMAWRYEHPATLVAWALVGARALGAPLLSVYLSMARPLPVTARDIMAQVELASGMGVIRDAVTVANDHTAPLEQKVALFGASAIMSEQDRSRLDSLMQRVSLRGTYPLPLALPSGGVRTPDNDEPTKAPISWHEVGVRTPRKRPSRSKRNSGSFASVEDKAWKVWNYGMSVEQLQKAARISRASAQKYHAKFSRDDADLIARTEAVS